MNLRWLVVVAALGGLVQELVYHSVRRAYAEVLADPLWSLERVQRQEQELGLAVRQERP